MQPYNRKKRQRAANRFLLFSLTAGLLLAPSLSSAGELVGPMPQTDAQTASGNTAASDPNAAAGTESPEAEASETETSETETSKTDSAVGIAATDTPDGTPEPSVTPAPTTDITPAPTGDGQTESPVEEGMLSPSSNSSDSVFGRASTEGVTDENLAALLSTLQGELPASNGQWAVYICDLFNDSEGSITPASSSMQAASLIKLFIMGAVYEDYETLCLQYGQDTIDANLTSMITVSDNDAANALVNYLGSGDSQSGMAAVNAFCQNHGYYDTSMGRLLLQSNEYGDNYTSVSDCGRFLKAVYLSGYEKSSQDFAYGESMFSLLAAQTRRNKIPAQLPEGVSVANKTGELSDVENDAGIIYDEGNDLILVFMSQNLSETGSAQNTIAALSREIYDYYN